MTDRDPDYGHDCGPDCGCFDEATKGELREAVKDLGALMNAADDQARAMNDRELGELLRSGRWTTIEIHEAAKRLTAAYSVREQHDRVWAAVTKDGGMRLSSREGWRDANYREWDVWVGPMVECPSCAFMFGADHTDDGGEGYSCPNCDYDGNVVEEPTS